MRKWIRDKWDEYAPNIILYAVMIVAGLSAGYGCMKCTEPTHHNYPYHDVETGRGQYEYGGSEEQVNDIINADKYMTDEEKVREAEYEKQVERELKEMQ